MSVELNINSYNAIAREWAKIKKPLLPNQFILDFLPHLPAGGTVLDVGCGSGCPLCKYLHEQGFKVTGIDVAKNMIKIANSLNLAGATFIECDFFDYKPAEAFDVVFAIDSFFHIELELQDRIYQHLATLVKPGGYVLYTHGNKHGHIVGEMLGHQFYYSSLDTQDGLEVLCKFGFSIIEAIEDYRDFMGNKDLVVIARKN